MRPREPWPLRAGSGSQGRRRLLPQVRPRSSGPSLTNTCMSGASWILSCRPRLVWAMMKKVEGLKSVTLAVDTGDKASVGCEGRDPPAAGGGVRPNALTCGDRHLGEDLVHKHLSTGLDRDDLGVAGSGVR